MAVEFWILDSAARSPTPRWWKGAPDFWISGFLDLRGEGVPQGGRLGFWILDFGEEAEAGVLLDLEIRILDFAVQRAGSRGRLGRSEIGM